MAKVAPTGEYSEAVGVVQGSGPGKGNGCCCLCCGGNPGPVPTEKITTAGGKFVKVENDRIVEYYTYGSTEPDAKVLLSFGGNFSTGYIFGHVKELGIGLAKNNVKGISISLPGVGYTSQNYGANLLNFATHDVGAVLDAEGRPAKIMVEGMSNGSIVAMSVAYAHLDKLESLHLMVPFISTKIATEEKLPNPLDDYLPCQANQCGPNSKGLETCCPGCLLFCCTSCCCQCMFCTNCSGKMDQHPDHDKALPDLAKETFIDTKRSFVHSSAGMCRSQTFTGLSPGFDIRDLAARFHGKDKVLVSFASNDKSAKPDHARYLIQLFDATWQVADGNSLTPKMDDGHGYWMVQLFTGKFAEQMSKMRAPGQESMDGNAFHGAPKPENFTLEIVKK
eukprot:TRINITY_DN100056_c0_g1_i1.p1 TRINITY_DN100056_c0_g1~~TRINITY_DN100056_c0_g1_i1.p1  ORF type:complete len:392 (-),score=59.87 TRINITY_DN100056_c0_g1_i1:135-1310(-)